LLLKARGRRAGVSEFLLFCNRERKRIKKQKKGGEKLENLSRTHET